MALSSLLSLLLPFGVLAIICLIVAASLRRRSPLPDGSIIFEDAGRNTRVLVSRRHGLQGKPDYILRDHAGVIPVELKSGLKPRGGQPHRAHVMQLAAYFLLMEDVMRAQAAYGLVQYSDGALRVENSPQLRAELLAVAGEMRQALRVRNVPRSHEQPRRCRACSLAYVCGQRLM